MLAALAALLVMPVSFAQEPPEIGVVAEAALAGLTRHPGCAAFQGEVTQTVHFAGTSATQTHAWRGELTPEGWRPWTATPIGEPDTRISVHTSGGGRPYPFVVTLHGRMLPAPPEGGAAAGGAAAGGPEAGGSEAGAAGDGGVAAGAAAADEGDEAGGDFAAASRGLLLDLLAAARTDVELETVERVREAPGTLRYVRSFSSRRTLFGRKENVLEVRLDEATLRPRVWTVRLDDPVRVDGKPGRIVKMQATLESDAEGWPTRDALDVTGGLGPFSARVERAIVFRRAGPCGTGG